MCNGRRVGTAGAEDIVADVFFAAVEALQSGRINQLTEPWMMGVARNKVMDHWRLRYRTGGGTSIYGMRRLRCCSPISRVSGRKRRWTGCRMPTGPC